MLKLRWVADLHLFILCLANIDYIFTELTLLPKQLYKIVKLY